MVSDAKQRILQQQGSFNPRPQGVTDPLFLQEPFFDPRDLVQVKYEMLRRVQSEGHSVTQAATAFGFSRPSFYQALSAFEQGGLGGLVPQKRGPKAAHKLTAEVLRFVREQQAADPKLRAPALAPLIARHFGVVVHPRSIERALAHSQKKRQAA
jgi:transposase